MKRVLNLVLLAMVVAGSGCATMSGDSAPAIRETSTWDAKTGTWQTEVSEIEPDVAEARERGEVIKFIVYVPITVAVSTAAEFLVGIGMAWMR